MSGAESVSVIQVVMAMAGSSVLGVIAAELIRKIRSQEDKDALVAVAARDHSQGEAAVIAAMAGAFTDTTSSLREEIDRMQDMLNDFRERVALAEAENRASQARIHGLEQVVEDQKHQLEIAHEDVLRLRGERDTALERVAQQEGEIRQLNAIAESAKRVARKP